MNQEQLKAKAEQFSQDINDLQDKYGVLLSATPSISPDGRVVCAFTIVDKAKYEADMQTVSESVVQSEAKVEDVNSKSL